MGVKGIDTAEIVFDDVQRRARPGDRRGVLADHAVAQRHAPDRRGARHRPRRGRADVRDRVREEPSGVRQDDRGVPGHPVGDRQVRDRDRGGASPHLPRGLAGRPGQVHQGVRAHALDVQVLRLRGRREGLGPRASSCSARRATWKTTRPSSTTATRASSRSSKARARSSSGSSLAACSATTCGGTEPVASTRPTYTDTVSGPLEGLKVVELAGLGPGPYACMMLADLGADVLRFERGDARRGARRSWDLLNRSRHSVAVDLKNAAGRDLVLELVRAGRRPRSRGFGPGSPSGSDSAPRTCWRAQPASRLRPHDRLRPGRAPLVSAPVTTSTTSRSRGRCGRSGAPGSGRCPRSTSSGDFGGGSLFLVFGVLAACVRSALERRGPGRRRGDGRRLGVAADA